MNRRPAVLFASCCGLIAWVALAQSAATIDAVRLHRPNDLALAQSELRACDGGSCARLSLLVGYLEVSSGQPEAAELQLASQPAPPELEAYRAYYLGQAQFYARDAGAAAESFLTALATAPPSLAPKVRARAAEALLASGDAGVALPLLDRAVADLDSPALYWERSQARAELGDDAGEAEDLHTLALRFPNHLYGQQALAELLAVGSEPFTFDERLSRARELAEENPQHALDELAVIAQHRLAGTKAQRARAALVEAGALYAIGKDDDADRAIQTAMSGPRDVAVEAAMLQARRALKKNDNDTARKRMNAIDQHFPKTRLSEEAAFYAGWLFFQAGQYAEAVRAFEAFERRHHRSRRRDEVLWFRALSLLRMNRYRQARTVLETLLHDIPLSPAVPEALYWSARSRELAKDPLEPAIASYQQIIRQFPNSFYEWLAELRLADLKADIPKAFPAPPISLAVPTPDALKIAVALSSAGLLRDALDVVQRDARSVRTPQSALVWGHALQRLGEYGVAYALAARELWGPAFTQKAPDALALFYPRAFESAVVEASRDNHLDAALIWSIMRRESSFKPEVRSGANARGLMQLIPPTAAQIAKILGDPIPAPDELFSPSINIRLGSWYLAQLEQRFGHWALVAAAYNAGPAPVDRWLRDRGDLPLDLFIEMIPYRDTRAYVKQVLADTHVYHLLYDSLGATPRLDLSLPTTDFDAGVAF